MSSYPFEPSYDFVFQPHDKLVKYILGQREILEEFMKKKFPSFLSDQIDENSFRILPTSSISTKLRLTAADIVASFTVQDDLYIMVSLLEHKSYPDKDIAFQLLEYIAFLWRYPQFMEMWGLRLQPHQRPIIIPTVLYHGKNPWNISTKLSDFLVGNKEICRGYIPDFEYNIIHIKTEDFDLFNKNRLLNLLMQLFYYVSENKLELHLEEILELMIMENGKLDEDLLERVISYIIHTTEISMDVFIQSLTKVLGKGADIMAKTTFEQYYEKRYLEDLEKYESLKLQLKEEQQKREEEQRKREEEQRKREEEQRKREEEEKEREQITKEILWDSIKIKYKTDDIILYGALLSISGNEKILFLSKCISKNNNIEDFKKEFSKIISA